MTPSDRSSLVKLASSLPVGSPERRVLIASLSRGATLHPVAELHEKNADVRFTTYDDPSYEVDVAGVELEFFPMRGGGVRIDMGKHGEGGYVVLDPQQFAHLAVELREALTFVENLSRTVSPSDLSALVKLASSLPAGSPERKTLLASLERTAAEYHEDDLKASLKLISEIDGKMKELVDLLDARYEGLGSVADAFPEASKLSQWLRTDVSKKLNQYKNALK